MTVSYSQYASWSPELQARYRKRYGSAPRPVASTNPPGQTFKPWTPWSSSPPSGTYDPSLDAAAAAANRGYGDLQSDVTTQNQRDTVDYGLSRDELIRQGMQTEADRQLAYSREGQDYGQTVSREGEKYDRNIAMLKRAYAVKGNAQGQQANAYGVLSGGALLQAASKRAANQALDQQPIDTNHTRTLADAETAHTRYQADSATQQQRTSDATQLALGKLALQMAPPDASNPLGGRSFQDRTTQLTRGGRENTQFGIDTEAQKAFQAGGMGWDPGTRPRGEYVDASGKPYQVKVVGPIKYRIDPSGHVISSVRRKRR